MGTKTKSEFSECAYIPLKQQPNRVWRTYQGGASIDRWKGIAPPTDGSLPEEWVMSTITARGKDRPENEGLSMIETPFGLIALRDLIAADPSLFLGKRLAEKYGTTGLLIKMLDSNERLTIQVHPDKTYARENLNSEFGKTESWYVLGIRENQKENSAVYMGFKKGVTREDWKELFMKQDIAGMLGCLHKIEVKPGDAFMIYGGVPHAIGSGCFLLEVQEPTDYTMRVEKVTPAGLEIDDALIHQGLGPEKMLECFHYDPCSYREALQRWKVEPTAIDSNIGSKLTSIFNENHTDCFGVSELNLKGKYSLSGQGHFFVGVVYHGSGTLDCDGRQSHFKQGDEIFFPAAIKQIIFTTSSTARILLCYPPRIN